MFLRDARGVVFRPTWNTTRAARGDDLRRALPPGSYTLLGYRIIREDDAGKDWFISSTAASMRELELVAGQTLELDLDATIVMECLSDIGRKGKRVCASVRDSFGFGVSIYKKGRRIPLGYELFDAGERSLGSGNLDYG